MNMFFQFPVVVIFSLLLIGCSGKKQINPSNENSLFTKEEIAFENKQEINNKLKEAYNAGENDGYNRAKKDFEEVIPYLKGIRASAEIKNSGGLCLPPLFLDKTNRSNISISIGKVHICDNFTVDNIINIAKSGIPSLENNVPINNIKPVSNAGENGFIPPSISIGGSEQVQYFIENEAPIVQKSIAKIKSTINNKNLLKYSNASYSEIEVDRDNYMYVTFDNKLQKEDFCELYGICEDDKDK